MKKTQLTTRLGKKIGTFNHHDQCRFCFSPRIKNIVDFGYVPLAGGFLPKNATKKDFKNELFYPLQIYFCPQCYLVQSNNTISGKTLFKNYFYLSSSIGTLVDHFEKYASDLKKLFPRPSKRLVVEIGCNDGVFLRPLKALGFKVLGVDPASNVTKQLKKDGFSIYNNFFGEKLASQILKKHKMADVICGTSSLAHIDDMHDILKGVKTILKPEGIFIIQEHYLGSLINEVQYDMMYHEHPSYYSLLSLSEFLEMYGMQVFDIKPLELRSGMMRYYIQNIKGGKHKQTKAVNNLINKEKRLGLNNLSTYKNFSKHINNTRTDLMKLISKLKSQNKRIVGYGASGRATTIMSYCKINKDHLDYMVDDAPAKQGAFTPGNHIRIRSSDILNDPKRRPDYAVVFAWPFIKEIKKKKGSYFKSGGKFIVPLPKVRVIKR